MQYYFPEEFDFLFDMISDIYFMDGPYYNKILIKNKSEFFEKLAQNNSNSMYVLLVFEINTTLAITARYNVRSFKFNDMICTLKTEECSWWNSIYNNLNEESIDIILAKYPNFVYHLDILAYFRTHKNWTLINET